MIPPELVDAVRTKTAILFVGAGVSMNLGLPSFSQLVEIMATELGYDAEVFDALAGNDVLAEYYILEKKSIGSLRSRLDVQWHAKNVQIEKSLIHRRIVELGFPLIYTTNYDRWLEKAHEYWGKPFSKIGNVDDIRSARQDVTQIVKFHGDFDDDSSLILTESSYFNRLDFTSPLDIKLRADSLGRTILFLGYGLNDVNIRLLMYKLHKIWKESPYAHARPKSYIVLQHPNLVEEAVLRERGVVPVVIEGENARVAVETFLHELGA